MLDWWDGVTGQGDGGGGGGGGEETDGQKSDRQTDKQIITLDIWRVGFVREERDWNDVSAFCLHERKEMDVWSVLIFTDTVVGVCGQFWCIPTQ